MAHGDASVGGNMLTNPVRGMPKDVWDIDAAIRMRLLHGADFGGGRRLMAAFEPDVSWIEVDDASRSVVAIYVKGAVRVTVRATLREDGDVEIVSATLGSICRQTP